MRILLVDDDPDARSLAMRALAREFEDATIVEATDPAGLERALAQPPDILVTDYDLRWTDGLAIFDRVRQASPGCCAVMFTGTGNEELAVRAMKHGFDDYVVKGAHQLRRLAASTRLAYERARERRELGENRDLILKELYHRLHNNLQIVVSLIRATGKALRDPADREQLDRLGRRVQALGSLQEAFYRSSDFRRVDFADFLRTLAAEVERLGAGRVGIDLDLAPLHLPVDVATPLALCVNELIVNALKHAFPGGRTGRLEVALRREGDAVTVRVADDGVGLPEEPREPHAGLGMGLVRRLAGQMAADLWLERTEAGTEWRIRIPVPAAS